MRRGAALAGGDAFVHNQAHNASVPAPGGPSAVTPLFRIPLCPSNDDGGDDPCYVLCMLRHDGPAPLAQHRSWWLVACTTHNDPSLTPPWRGPANDRIDPESDRQGPGSRRGCDPGGHARGGWRPACARGTWRESGTCWRTASAPCPPTTTTATGVGSSNTIRGGRPTAAGPIATGRAATGCDAEHDTTDPAQDTCTPCTACLSNAPQVFFHPEAPNVDRAHGMCCDCWRAYLLANDRVVCYLCKAPVPSADVQRMVRECGMDYDALMAERKQKRGTMTTSEFHPLDLVPYGEVQSVYDSIVMQHINNTQNLMVTRQSLTTPSRISRRRRPRLTTAAPGCQRPMNSIVSNPNARFRAPAPYSPPRSNASRVASPPVHAFNFRVDVWPRRHERHIDGAPVPIAASRVFTVGASDDGTDERDAFPLRPARGSGCDGYAADKPGIFPFVPLKCAAGPTVAPPAVRFWGVHVVKCQALCAPFLFFADYAWSHSKPAHTPADDARNVGRRCGKQNMGIATSECNGDGGAPHCVAFLLLAPTYQPSANAIDHARENPSTFALMRAAPGDATVTYVPGTDAVRRIALGVRRPTQ